ncbi:MAG: hypothetical protein PHH26_07505 [Candidatus Thermoplasmatota archaeon]|nr:hypothetical protein [Candidatus Thermoplasmatota archaeon]
MKIPLKFIAVALLLAIFAAHFSFSIFPNDLFLAPDTIERKYGAVTSWNINDGWDNYTGVIVIEFAGLEYGKDERVLHYNVVKDGSDEAVPNTEFYAHITPQVHEMKFTRINAGYFLPPWNLEKDGTLELGAVQNDGTPEGQESVFYLGQYKVIREEEILGEKCWVWHYEANNLPLNMPGSEVYGDISNYYWYSEKYERMVKAESHLIVKMKYGELVKTLAEQQSIPFVGDFYGALSPALVGYPVNDNTLVRVYQFDYTMRENSSQYMIDQGRQFYILENFIVPGVSLIAFVALPVGVWALVERKTKKKKT